LSKSERDFAGDFLKEKGLKSKARFVVVHPGHRGSALNWKPERYAQLVERLCKTKGLRVVLTGGAEETAIIARVTAMRTPFVSCRVPLGPCTWRPLWERPRYPFSARPPRPRLFGGDPGATNRQCWCPRV
jgi:hypothetical protein